MNLPNTKKEFLNRYYLKNELLEICKENNLPTNGSKGNLVKYICDFIENESITKIRKEPKKITRNFMPSLKSIIDVNYSNDEIHRAFFIKEIGKHFKYNVQFMNWMKENKGKRTYQEAIEKWNNIFMEKKSGKKYKIGSQFEYNQYTRDFFENNPELSREDCIKCWKYKKQQTGKHIYGKDDLDILKKKILNEKNDKENGKPFSIIIPVAGPMPSMWHDDKYKPDFCLWLDKQPCIYACTGIGDDYCFTIGAPDYIIREWIEKFYIPMSRTDLTADEVMKKFDFNKDYEDT